MKTTPDLTWDDTLAALLPLVGRQVWGTTLVDEYPIASLGGVLRAVDVEHVEPSGVEVAELHVGDGVGHVLLRRDEHLGSGVDADGGLRVDMVGWALELEGP